MTVRECIHPAALGQALSRRIGEPRYKLWFENHTKFNWDGGTLTVGVPNRHFEEWLQKKFHEAVRDAAGEVFGETQDVRFVIDPQLFRAARQEQAEARQETTTVEVSPPVAPSIPELPGPQRQLPVRPVRRPRRKTADAGPTLFDRPAERTTRRWRKLDDFVVGPCNRVAHAAAVSIVELPAESSGPLVLHGPVGTGKTHLLEGIYVGFRRAHPDWHVRYVTAEDFTNRFVQAMRLNKLCSFRKTFRECDVLLLDDLQFLAGKKATRGEFLHTFDALQVEGKPLVLTSDCHPRLADEFPAELTDRLLGGAVWGLAPPDTATRLDMLRAKSVRGGDPPISEEVLTYIASQLRGNVRELEGALNNLRHFGRATGRVIDLNLAREALADHFRHAVRVVQLADVDAAINRVLRLPGGALQSKQRAWAISHPRMLAIYLGRKHTMAAYSEIGEFFGGRNHSTAVAAERKVRHWLENNDEVSLGERKLRVREIIESVERELLR